MRFEMTDWIFLILTLFIVIAYGVYRSRSSRNLEGYFLSGRDLPWWLVMLSIMGTQASAITFLTAPGQAYTDGMRFIQYYFGLPLAMIVLCITLVPLFHRLGVFTAYEFLEKRFDLKTRLLTSFLFLLSRGLSTGISIFAPSMVLHSMLGWDIYWTNVFMGGLLIVYTVSGGARAVAYTQQLQFLIIYAAMFVAGWYAIHSLPEGLGISEALHIAGKSGKLNVITTGFTDAGFDWKDKYNIWSGVIGGFFLALSYFGTDQSQVGRYLTAKNLQQSRSGLLMNGILKVPLQFMILLLGCLVFSYYSFFRAPAFFNRAQESMVLNSKEAEAYRIESGRYAQVQQLKNTSAVRLAQAIKEKDQAAIELGRTELKRAEEEGMQIRKRIQVLIQKAAPGTDVNDTNYIFLRFVGDVLPVGWVGIIIAIIFLAAWGSIAAALNALSSCTLIDFHQRLISRPLQGAEAVRWGMFYTFLWGAACVVIAQYAYHFGNSLIESVNILGSWFYGTILGIFLVAFYLKKVNGHQVFAAAILTEGLVIYIYYQNLISFLWLNVAGALGVMLLASIFSATGLFQNMNIFKRNHDKA